MSTESSQKARIIKANYMLRAKVGAGPLDEQTIRRCQQVIDKNTVDFAPLAKEFLDKLRKAIDDTKQAQPDQIEYVQYMVEPVMQLKANATTFHYTLVGNMANLMLSFLETVKELDPDVIEIVEAHHKTLNIIIEQQMKGDGGAYGKQLEDELKNACQRYFKRKRQT